MNGRQTLSNALSDLKIVCQTQEKRYKTYQFANKEQDMKRERIRVFDTGNGDTIVDKIDDGGYQFIIKNIDGYSCCLLITNSTFDKCRCALNGNNSMRQFGLNNALMLAYAFAGSFRV